MEKNETCEIIQPELCKPTNEDDSDDSDDSEDSSYDMNNNNKDNTKNSIFANIMDAGELVASDNENESDETNTIYEEEKTNGYHSNNKVISSM